MPTTGDLPFFGEPPTRRPMRVSEVPALRGKRVILSRPDGFIYDVRAVSELHTDGRGRAVVEVCTERDYYAWMLGGPRPQTRTYPAALVWVE
jgi:hypothetical protein